MAELKISNDLQNVIKKVVLDTYFPIGSLYLTVGSENPNTTIGGTWTKLSGYYLYADTSINNTSYTGKHTQSHTLTENQIPKHRHYFQYSSADREYSNIVNGENNNQNFADLADEGHSIMAHWCNDGWERSGLTSETGGSGGHSHNIATKGIYVWQRTK